MDKKQKKKEKARCSIIIPKRRLKPGGVAAKHAGLWSR